MLLRKIGKTLRGKSTPFQILSATILCGLLGALPGVTQGPLLLILLLFLLIVLNANLFLGGLTLLIVKLISLVLLPVYFQVGATLLEGPLNGVVSSLVNMPVLAWFGFEYYVTIPSLLVGLVLGIFLGLLFSRGLRAFRVKMSSLESGSEKYQQYVSRWWVKLLAWLFVGGVKGKKSWKELSEQKKGLPVRPLGIVFVISLTVLMWVGVQFLDSTIVTSVLRDQLEQANGATVDLAGVEILPSENQIIINELNLANPEKLDTNRFSTRQITADLSGFSLLSKKLVVDKLYIVEPKSGESRKVPGKRIIELPEQEPEAETGDVISIDDYLGQASIWRERLRTAKRVYDKIAPYIKRGEKDASDEPEQLSWREELALRAKELGYSKVKSDSLITHSPRLLIRELNSDNMVLSGSDDRFVISAENVSSQPALLDKPGKILINRMDGELEVEMGLPDREHPNRSAIRIRYLGMEIDELADSVGNNLPMSGGTLDISGTGTITGGYLELPLKVVLNDTTLAAFGQTLPVDDFPIQVALTGTLDKPSLTIPKDAIQEAILAGGKKKVENMIKEEAGDQLKKLFNFGG